MDRAERRKRTFNIVCRRTELAYHFGLFLEADEDGGVRDVPNPKRVGSCKKKHPFDCGRSNCGLCSKPRKLYKEDTRQERKAALTAREQVDEHNEN